MHCVPRRLHGAYLSRSVPYVQTLRGLSERRIVSGHYWPTFGYRPVARIGNTGLVSTFRTLLGTARLFESTFVPSTVLSLFNNGVKRLYNISLSAAYSPANLSGPNSTLRTSYREYIGPLVRPETKTFATKKGAFDTDYLTFFFFGPYFIRTSDRSALDATFPSPSVRWA